MSKKILIIDDEAHIVQVLLLKLRNAGYEVVSASDGEEGLAAALEHRPDMIITDFQMPYMTGLELCRALQDHPETAGIPVVLLTARGYALDSEMGSPAGSSCGVPREVLSKPFSPRAIVETIQRILGEQEQKSDVKDQKSVAAATTPTSDFRPLNSEREAA